MLIELEGLGLEQNDRMDRSQVSRASGVTNYARAVMISLAGVLASMGALEQKSQVQKMTPAAPLTSPEKASLPTQKKLADVSEEKLLEEIAFYEKEIEDLKKELVDVENLQKPYITLRDQHVQKYGPIGQPTLTMNPSFTQTIPENEAFPFTHVEKNEDYLTLVKKLHAEAEMVLKEFKLLWILGEKALDANQLLPDIEQFRKKDNRLKSSYFINKQFPIDSAEATLSFISYIAERELQYMESASTTFDEMEIDRIREELRAKRPDLFVEAGKEEVMALLDPVLRKVLKGYPEHFPHITVHDTRKAFEAAQKEPSLDTAAFHEFATDSIHGEKKPLLDLLMDIAHECGHPVVRSSEGIALLAITNYVKRFENYHALQHLDEEALRIARQLRIEQDPTKRAQLLESRRGVLIRRSGQLLMIQIPTVGLDFMNEINPRKPDTQEDEAGAFVMQGMLLRACFADDPEVQRMVMHLNEWSNQSRDFDHYAGFALAKEELKRTGNPPAVMSALAAIDTPEEVAVYAPRLNALNEKADIAGGTLGFLEQMSKKQRMFDIKDFISETRENSYKKFNEYDRRKNDPTFIPELKEDIRKRQKEIAKLSGLLFDYVYPRKEQ